MAKARPPDTLFGSIPSDVRTWVRNAFRVANRRVSEAYSRMPTTREEALDLQLIAELSTTGPRTQLPSGWIVDIQTHFLGGGRHWGNWEVADIGVLISLREGAKLRATKSAVLQSKRLYVDEITSVDEMDATDYRLGFSRLAVDGTSSPSVLAPRTFSFTTGSKYRALEYESAQWKAIAAHEHARRTPVHFLFYNPIAIPRTVQLPLRAPLEKMKANAVGCRVVPFHVVESVLQSCDGKTLTIGDLSDLKYRDGVLDGAGWRLETFVADQMLRCFEGAYAEGSNIDVKLQDLFYRRSGPIASAFAITIDAPRTR
jgi:hypothetical protein